MDKALLLAMMLLLAVHTAISFKALYGKEKPDFGRYNLIFIPVSLLNLLFIIMKITRIGFYGVIGSDEYLTLFAMVIMICQVIILNDRQAESLSLFLSPLLLVILLASFFLQGGKYHEYHGMNSPIYAFHYIFSLIAYGVLTLAAVGAVYYLIQARNLKLKRLKGAFSALPSLHTLDKLCYRYVAVGFPFLFLGVLFGSIWAYNLTGALWLPGFRESTSFLTLFLFLIYIHIRIISGWRGITVNTILLIAYSSIILFHVLNPTMFL